MSSSEPAAPPLRRPLFRKYFVVLFTAVAGPLLVSGLAEAWLDYRTQRALVDDRLRLEARVAAGDIGAFLDGIRDQLGWAVQLPWTEANAEAHRVDALRLLQRLPAAMGIVLVDGDGQERLRVSRIERDVVDSGRDLGTEPAFLGAREAGVWYGPVTLNRGSEPYMEIALAGSRRAAGVAIAEINLKLIRDVVSAIRFGAGGGAFVVDGTGRLIGHSDLDRVLRGDEVFGPNAFSRLRGEVIPGGRGPILEVEIDGRVVLAAMAPVPGTDWLVLAGLPLSEAQAPIRAALERTGWMVLGGAGFALLLAAWLARRMTGPIRLLEDGAGQISAGRFDHRIRIRTGDELERLAGRFNRMAGELALSAERSERIARLKRFLSPQVAEIVDSSDEAGLLDARRVEVVVVFGDLRGFTDFSLAATPEEIMRVLADYYAAVGDCIAARAATLTQLSGDGVMILVNAPLPAAGDPAVIAARMAIEMQAAVQPLCAGWRALGHRLGFGIGIARGKATVGRVGYEGRHDYTAIGPVVNLAARLCDAAADGEILLDAHAAASAAGELPLVAAGHRRLKGFPEAVRVHAVAGAPVPAPASGGA